jgi:hypothetical protein
VISKHVTHHYHHHHHITPPPPAMTNFSATEGGTSDDVSNTGLTIVERLRRLTSAVDKRPVPGEHFNQFVVSPDIRPVM